MNKKQKMYEAIEKHGQNLNNIFKTKFDNVTLCKKLFRLETKAHHATTCLCNTNTLNLLELPNTYMGKALSDFPQATEEEQNRFFSKINKKLVEILGRKANMIHINFDPRGYALKIKEDYIKDMPLHRDFGGYGILAPDFNN